VIDLALWLADLVLTLLEMLWGFIRFLAATIAHYERLTREAEQ
jgi:hypothetical protein